MYGQKIHCLAVGAQKLPYMASNTAPLQLQMGGEAQEVWCCFPSRVQGMDEVSRGIIIDLGQGNLKPWQQPSIYSLDRLIALYRTSWMNFFKQYVI